MIGAPVVWSGIVWIFGFGLDFDSFARASFRTVAILLIFPVLEEIVFRGLIQDYLSNKTTGWDSFLGITWANWLTTLLFCVTHLVTRSMLVASLVIVPSLLLGALRDRGFSIKALAAIHLYWNGGVYLLIGLPSS
jgi:membrane protease YdiL (CAAX protease family)